MAREPLDDGAFIGYLMAVIAPLVGILVGCALIARGERHGPSVVGWSVLSLFVWTVIVTFLWLLFLASMFG